MEFNSGVIPPSACASRLSMFSHTTEAAFSTSMLILPATPAHNHRTVCRPTLIHRTSWLVRCRIWKSLRKTITVSYDVNVVTVMHVKLSSQSQAETDVTHLTLGQRWAMYCHHCSFTSQHGGFVRSTQYSSKEQKWSGHSFVLAPICWSVVAPFRLHWSVQRP